MSACGVPGALRAVGADEVVHDAAGGRPLGERGAGTELDVVGMGADRQRHAGTARSTWSTARSCDGAGGWPGSLALIGWQLMALSSIADRGQQRRDQRMAAVVDGVDVDRQARVARGP